MLCVFMTWMLARPPSAFAEEAEELLPAALLPRLTRQLRDALRGVALLAAPATAVSRRACVSTGANALAAESMPVAALTRAARGAKLAALCDVFTLALDEGIMNEPHVQTELASRCEPGAVPQRRANYELVDSAENWQFVAHRLRWLLTDPEVIIEHAGEYDPDGDWPEHERQALLAGDAFYTARYKGGILLGFFGTPD